MECQKITNLSGNIADKVPRFSAKKVDRSGSSIWRIIQY